MNYLLLRGLKLYYSNNTATKNIYSKLKNNNAKRNLL